MIYSYNVFFNTFNLCGSRHGIKQLGNYDSYLGSIQRTYHRAPVEIFKIGCFETFIIEECDRLSTDQYEELYEVKE